MEAKIQGLEILLKVSEALSESTKELDTFVKLNKGIIPDEHKHLLEGIDKKSISELEKLKDEIDKLGA